MSRLSVRKAFELLEADVKKAMKIRKRKHAQAQAQPKPVPRKRPRIEIVVPELKKFDFSNNKKSAVEEFKETEMVDRTEENVKILLQSEQLKPKTEAAQKVLEFHEKEQKKRDIEPVVEEKEPESVLFPELNETNKKKKKEDDE
ncbi:hypothetical protein JTE90_013281 [Oedothorax gibbosus]|uniref:Uncharacterized protein n=1 Tax=Oedothorax gibbosus TaxID=931172 RepID=A0AAV6VEV5_9ARAC|nr:hypothetical protein JTE90_013281 [Oedothorax gibbosus]